MRIYLTTDELSQRIKYDPRYIKQRLKGNVFKKGIHYITPFGGKKTLFIWDEVEKAMMGQTDISNPNPMDGIVLKKRRA